MSSKRPEWVFPSDKAALRRFVASVHFDLYIISISVFAFNHCISKRVQSRENIWGPTNQKQKG